MHIRRQRPYFYTIPSDASINRHIGDGHSGRYPDQATQRHRHRQFSARRHHHRGDRANYAGRHEVGAPSVAPDREDVGQQAPYGLHDPRNVVEPDVELDHGRLDLLDVLPVEVGDDLEEGVGEALAEAVDEGDSEDEGGVELFAEHLEPLEWLEEESEHFGSSQTMVRRWGWRRRRRRRLLSGLV